MRLPPCAHIAIFATFSRKFRIFTTIFTLILYNTSEYSHFHLSFTHFMFILRISYTKFISILSILRIDGA